MSATTFHVAGLAGITFTPTYDAAKKWLLIEGYDRDGDLVSRSGFSVTPDPIPDIAITPEPETDSDADPALQNAAESFVRAAKAESGGTDGPQ